MSSSPGPAGGFACIMTHFDLSSAASARGRLALGLADQFGAHLIGVAAEQMMSPIYPGGMPDVSAEAVDEECRRARGDLAAAKRTFEDVVGSRDGVEWRDGLSQPERFLIKQARAADLVVVGRWATYDERDLNLGVSPGVVVMECGRPMLVVPPEKDFLVARKIVVAWKDTVEARRAVRDALPFLRRAEEVVVMAIPEGGRADDLDDVLRWLARHGVGATPSIRGAGGRSVAHELLDLAEDAGADLVVSGAYGHSRMREWFFGGATRDLLEASGACLFMSH